MLEKIILFVEDNPDDVALTLEAFRAIKFPFKIVVTRDGAEALDFLFATGEYSDRDKKRTPLLILLDIKMPKVGGLEVMRRLRADPVLKDVPVVVLSSHALEVEQAEARTLGAILYIRKGTSYHEYINIAKRVQETLAVSKK